MNYNHDLTILNEFLDGWKKSRRTNNDSHMLELEDSFFLSVGVDVDNILVEPNSFIQEKVLDECFKYLNEDISKNELITGINHITSEEFEFPPIVRDCITGDVLPTITIEETKGNDYCIGVRSKDYEGNDINHVIFPHKKKDNIYRLVG